MTSWPSALSNAAATDESTPPDMATTMRWRSPTTGNTGDFNTSQPLADAVAHQAVYCGPSKNAPQALPNNPDLSTFTEPFTGEMVADRHVFCAARKESSPQLRNSGATTPIRWAAKVTKTAAIGTTRKLCRFKLTRTAGVNLNGLYRIEWSMYLC
jgi:hypothetical protein